jgi:elongation factor Ts
VHHRDPEIFANKRTIMAAISASTVKELRDITGAGMMDCKHALSETDGDVEAAVDWLRKKGLSKAAKKAGRVAADGLVGVCASGTSGAVIEVNAETDFVARNETFQAFVHSVASIALTHGDSIDAIRDADLNGKTVGDTLTSLVATIGENMGLRRVQRLSVTEGVVAHYVHGAVAPDLGKIGVIVALESAGDASMLKELGRKIAMHIAATSPLAARVEELDPAIVERERDVFADQARQSGKPEAIIEKMVEGRIRKFYEESVLLEQSFVMDPDHKVKDIIANAAKDAGASIEMTAFARFTLGEGIEKAEEDFAAEVAAAVGTR